MDNMFLRMIEGRGRLVYRAPVKQTNPDGTVELLPGSGARYAVIFSAFWDAVNGATAIMEVIPGTNGSAANVWTLTQGQPSIILKYEDIGDLVFSSWRVADASGSGFVTATEIVWHPPED